LVEATDDFVSLQTHKVEVASPPRSKKGRKCVAVRTSPFARRGGTRLVLLNGVSRKGLVAGAKATAIKKAEVRQ